MSEFQLILAIIALFIFVIFFKQLFSGNYPKRGIDYEAKVSNDSIANISAPTKVLNSQTSDKKLSRVEELFNIAKESLEKGDNLEAKKALQSLLILEPNNIDALRMLAVAYMNMYDYSNAKDTLLELLKLNPDDDLAHNLLANLLHKLGEDEDAIIHHQKAIKLDSSYGSHYYNYANTLYDLGQKDEAIKYYKKALELDPTLEEAKKILRELEDDNNK